MAAQANQPSADVPEDVRRLARDKLCGAIQDNRVGAAVKMTMFGRTFDAFLAAFEDAILADRQTREEARDGGGWPTIDSARRDGTTILIGRYNNGWEEITTASWNMYPKVGEEGLHGFRGYMDCATHWNPLPAPPAIEPSPVEGDRR